MRFKFPMVLAAVALTALLATTARAGTLTSLGTDDNGDLLIYDSGNNVTWLDYVYIDTATNLQNPLDGDTVIVNGTAITGWKLPLITQLTTLHGELAAGPASWAPFYSLPTYDKGDSFVSTSLVSGNYEREALTTGNISTGTGNGVYGSALYFVPGQLAVVPLPSAAWASFGMLGLLGVVRMRKAWR
jgi:hypothetical protein